MCKHCVAVGGVNDEGNSKGVSWESTKYMAHSLHVKHEEEEQQLSQANAKLFATTIVNHHDSLQSVDNASDLSSSLPVEAIVEGIRHMAVSNNNSTSAQESSPSSLAEGIRCMNIGSDVGGSQGTKHTPRRQARPHINAICEEEILRRSLD